MFSKIITHSFRFLNRESLEFRLVSKYNTRYISCSAIQFSHKQKEKGYEDDVKNQTENEITNAKEINEPVVNDDTSKEIQKHINKNQQLRIIDRPRFVGKKIIKSEKEDKQKEDDTEWYQYDEEHEKEPEEKSDEEKDKQMSKYTQDIITNSLVKAKNKNKEAFLECIRMYERSSGKKRERVAFVYGAMKYMKEFGVHKDLSVYKKLIEVFPKETMVPTNYFQTLFMHYPREQYCCISLLEQMEDNGVIPDPETETILLNIFGQNGIPLEKFWKMMYWMPKFRNLNPWPVPKPLPNDPLELAKLAMIKISSVDVESSISVHQTEDIEDSIDKTWVVSAMAPKQKELLLKHDKNTPIYVEGPFKIYVATESVDYFILRAEPLKNRKFPEMNTDDVDKIPNPYLDTHTTEVILPPSVHEQFDGTFFAVCATGMSTKDSLLSWIRCLQKDNPILGDIPIIFTLRNVVSEKKNLIDGGIKSEESRKLASGLENVNESVTDKEC
ncbi:hypothetical protein TKK_0015960 [Trichogramma kaykai]|uniref:Evolutionarily conserved signaling intermediate in Toll pathway, mitochondrial n=1 Tax=Trichogramma kaykai TaxID=54128 RepID=A0ABD2W946_9HYME